MIVVRNGLFGGLSPPEPRPPLVLFQMKGRGVGLTRLYVEWQNRGVGGGNPYLEQYRLQNITGGVAIKEVLNAKNSID